MGTKVPAKRLALDTNVLMDLAAGLNAAHVFRERFQAAGYDLRVPPTVLSELAHFATGPTGERKNLAVLALRTMLRWKLTPIVLSEVEMCQRANFVAFVQDRGVLPAEEENDALILAETGLADFKALVTSDMAILAADPRELERAYRDSGISPVVPVHPARMANALR